MGSDDEEEMDPLWIEDYCVRRDITAGELNNDVPPSVQVELDEYQTLCWLWHRALLVKIMGWNITFRVLELCLKDLWKLSQCCEMVALENEYVVVHFYLNEDYQKVLT